MIKKYTATYGNLFVVVCAMHRESRRDELTNVQPVMENQFNKTWSCAFCVGKVPSHLPPSPIGQGGNRNPEGNRGIGR